MVKVSGTILPKQSWVWPDMQWCLQNVSNRKEVSGALWARPLHGAPSSVIWGPDYTVLDH